MDQEKKTCRRHKTANHHPKRERVDVQSRINHIEELKIRKFKQPETKSKEIFIEKQLEFCRPVNGVRAKGYIRGKGRGKFSWVDFSYDCR